MAEVPDDRRLAVALAANRPGSGVPHVLVNLPSLSIADSLLEHYGSRLPALEHRYLLSIALLARIPDCEMVFVCSLAPTDIQLDDCFDLLPAAVRADCRARLHVVSLDDVTPRSLSAKLLDRPDLLARIRALVGTRPALVDPWNVTEHEVAVARALDLPVNGTDPRLRPLAFKSEGRRRLTAAGVPVPVGVEDVRTAVDVVAAVAAVRRHVPGCPAVVVKLDDSASGDGNRVLDLGPGCDTLAAARHLPPWFLGELAAGGVVEELVGGAGAGSPSAQVDLVPDGRPVVVATHEQVLGGETGQVYLGCRFPADPGHAPRVAALGAAVAADLARSGALGRLSVDFVAVPAPDPAAGPGAGAESTGERLVALEVNLRKGGTTHPFTALRNLVPGHYEADPGRWVAGDGSERCYVATDNLVDPGWTGRDPADVIATVRDAGLRFEHSRGVGVVLHMLSCLAIDGRCGVVAIGTSRAHAADLYATTVDALHR